jgi:hypothetical protein
MRKTLNRKAAKDAKETQRGFWMESKRRAAESAELAAEHRERTAALRQQPENPVGRGGPAAPTCRQRREKREKCRVISGQ